MAAYIISIRGTPRQAALLGLSAAIGHTVIVWFLAVAALLLGQKLIVEQAEPWLALLSGVLVTLLALRMFLRLKCRNHHHHRDHSHNNDHHHNNHNHNHDHSHDDHPRQKNGATAGDIVWFGFSGGLLPCPSAIAVLLVCIRVAMVAAFSIGLALTLVGIGIAASFASKRPAPLGLGLTG
jgi:nickel/cobalt exporter